MMTTSPVTIRATMVDDLDEREPELELAEHPHGQQVGAVQDAEGDQRRASTAARPGTRSGQ